MKSKKYSERLFLAIELPRFARDQLVEARKIWRKQLSKDVRWVPPLQLFLPIRYLGELPVSKSKQLCRKLEKLSRETSPIQLSVDQIGGAPSQEEAKRLWLGFEPSAELENFRKAIENCCRELKIEADKKPFESRITLSRSSDSQPVPKLQVKNHLKGFKVKGVSLIESRLGQNGPSYHPVRKFALTAEQNAET